MIEADFALINAHQLVTVSPGSHLYAEGDLGVIGRGALAALRGKIVWVGPQDDFHQSIALDPGATVLNAHGRTVLPGFVDPHTHPVFAGDRTGDFYGRALGTSYAEQLREGGIMHTVHATRKQSEDGLLELAFHRADQFLLYGTTTIEAKTGYGLEADAESKSLDVLNRLQSLHPLKVVPAFLGAHVVPEGYPGGAAAYVDDVVKHQLPRAEGKARFVDVWCDEGAFTPDQCRRIMERARDMGFLLTAHANEMGRGLGVQLAAQMGAKSVDHVVYLDDDDILAIRESGTVAVLLPGTTLFLTSNRYADARRLLDGGVRVALGTDFNPGTSPTQNMQFILSLAVLKLEMTAEEAIRGATLNAAIALDMDACVGSLQPGKYCDLSIFRVGDYRAIPYHYAMNLVESVVAGGRVVVRDGHLTSGRSA